jgi:hypothetical protein
LTGRSRGCVPSVVARPRARARVRSEGRGSGSSAQRREKKRENPYFSISCMVVAQSFEPNLADSGRILIRIHMMSCRAVVSRGRLRISVNSHVLDDDLSVASVGPTLPCRGPHGFPQPSKKGQREMAAKKKGAKKAKKAGKKKARKKARK